MNRKQARPRRNGIGNDGGLKEQAQGVRESKQSLYESRDDKEKDD